MSNSLSSVPSLSKGRSRFNLSHTHTTSFNMGDLVPVLVKEVVPSDTFKITSSTLIRLTSYLLKPIMGNLYLDVIFFFVPNRLLFSEWQKVIGDEEDSWTPPSQSGVYFAPMLNLRSDPSTPLGFKGGTVGDYLGIPPGITPSDVNQQVSMLPFLAFAKVWDDWFRNQVTEDSINFDALTSVGAYFDYSRDLDDQDLPWGPTNIFSRLPKVNKLVDYFTRSLPDTQRGPSVSIPLIKDLPVTTTIPGDVPSGSYNPIAFSKTDGTAPVAGVVSLRSDSGPGYLQSSDNAPTGTLEDIYPYNLVAKGANQFLVSVSDLRMSLAMQRIFESRARGGVRYTEIIQSLFGIMPKDGRLQRSEVLGGTKERLNINQVAQTSGSGDYAQTKLGDLGAFSSTHVKTGVRKAFDEYGFIVGVACVRQDHSYPQGVDKMFFRKENLDFYNPLLSKISEQPVYQREIYYEGNDNDKNVFGFLPYAEEYRLYQNRVSSSMRPYVPNNLAQWNISDNYTNPPVIGKEFTNETSNNLDRVVGVPSESTNNFIADFYFKITAYRPLSAYGVPGGL